MIGRIMMMRPGGWKWLLAAVLFISTAVFRAPWANGDDVRLPEGVLATAGGDSVGAEEFLYYLQSREVNLPQETAEREGLLRDFLVDRKLAGEAKRSGLVDTPEVQAIADAMDRRELPEIYFRKEFLEKTAIEEADFERFYADLTDLADIRVAVLATESEARELRTLLLSGRSIESLAGERSLGNSAQKGGLVQGVVRGDVRFTLEEKNAIFSAPLGEARGPFENKLGQFSVLQVVSRSMVEDQKREIREKKQQDARSDKAATAYALRLEEEMRATEIDINEEYFEEKETGKPQKPYIAWIRGKYIYPRDLGVDTARESHGKKVYRTSLDKMLRSIVAVGLARKAGLADLPEYRRKQEAFLVARLAEAQVQSVFNKFQPKVSDQDVRKYYKENYHPDVYSVWVVINRDRGKVEKARKEVLKGAKDADVAREYSDDASRMRGGMTGLISYSGFAPEVRKRLSSHKEGKVSEVFGMDGKYLIMKVVEKKTVAVPKYEDVKDKARKSIQLQKKSAAAQDHRASTLKMESVRIDRDALATLK